MTLPQNTPRGYTYPCYSDLVDFPAQIQDLATDIDGDVQGILTNIGDARNTPPSCYATSVTPVVLVNGALTTLTFTTQVYDNANMFTPPSANITVPVEGLYLIDYRCTFSGSNNGVRLVQLGVGGLVRSMQGHRRAGASGQMTVTGQALSFAAMGAVINLLAGVNGATTAGSAVTFHIAVTRMTGTTLL